MTSIKLYEGNCLDVLRKCPDNYMDSIVTDPPYGLSFMGKGWDYSVPSTEIWKECLRVLKPGGHLLAFGGTRTYHRLVVNIEDAGFEIRDQIMWIYGSGFPKSQNIALAIDKQLGVESEVIGENPSSRPNSKIKGNRGFDEALGEGESAGIQDLKAPTSEAAKKHAGYGTALKPANEPICLARKPLSEKTVAKNVLKHGVGGLNVDASRIGENPGYKYPNGPGGSNANTYGEYAERGPVESTQGRFPANILFDEFAAGVLDEQSGQSGDKARVSKANALAGNGSTMGMMKPVECVRGFADSGGASRFFYVAKASKKDRNYGLQIGNEQLLTSQQNTHPTVKPIKLMEYLVKLVTPEGGIVLDPFMGSGTTGVACQNLGFGFRGIEMTPEYYEICKARLLGAAKDAV